MLIQYFNLNFVETPYQPSPFSPLLFIPCSRVVSEPWVWRDRHMDNTCDHFISLCVANQQSGRVYEKMIVFNKHRVQKLGVKELMK